MHGPRLEDDSAVPFAILVTVGGVLLLDRLGLELSVAIVCLLAAVAIRPTK